MAEVGTSGFEIIDICFAVPVLQGHDIHNGTLRLCVGRDNSHFHMLLPACMRLSDYCKIGIRVQLDVNGEMIAQTSHKH